MLEVGTGSAMQLASPPNQPTYVFKVLLWAKRCAAEARAPAQNCWLNLHVRCSWSLVACLVGWLVGWLGCLVGSLVGVCGTTACANAPGESNSLLDRTSTTWWRCQQCHYCTQAARRHNRCSSGSSHWWFSQPNLRRPDVRHLFWECRQRPASGRPAEELAIRFGWPTNQHNPSDLKSMSFTVEASFGQTLV